MGDSVVGIVFQFYKINRIMDMDGGSFVQYESVISLKCTFKMAKMVNVKCILPLKKKQ
jgi:hypothetical protein